MACQELQDSPENPAGPEKPQPACAEVFPFPPLKIRVKARANQWRSCLETDEVVALHDEMRVEIVVRSGIVASSDLIEN